VRVARQISKHRLWPVTDDLDPQRSASQDVSLLYRSGVHLMMRFLAFISWIMSGSTGTKSAIAHQVQIGHLFCTRHAIPSCPANVPENTQKFAS
jgi:hypothetical protein